MTADAAVEPQLAARRPESLGELFRVFNRLALQGFGGVLPVARFELVEREQWLAPDEFVELLAICQVMPGPNVISLALLFGHRYFGLRGAAVGVAGMLAVPTVLVLGLALVYGRIASHPAAVAALRGMGAVSAGLIISTAVKSMPALRRNALGVTLGVALTLATIVGLLWLHLALYYLVPVLGGFGTWAAWRALRRRGTVR
ncbi:MAG: chromate transporter [Pelomonas sp.]|nr:chromate transporter [Roseateles sp.]